MKIIFIRHSNSKVEPEKYNPLWKLGEKGIARAEQLAKSELLTDIEIIYTSNQLKAIHTGVIVASEIGVPLMQEPNLTELTSLTNEWKEDFDGFVHDIYTGVIERWGDGESLEEACTRFTKTVEDIVTKESNRETVGIVTHGNVLSLFSAQYEDRSALEIHNVIEQPDLAIFDWDTKTFNLKFGEYVIND